MRRDQDAIRSSDTFPCCCCRAPSRVSTRTRARNVGADGHITKPFEAQALVDRVNQLLAHAEAGRPVGGVPTRRCWSPSNPPRAATPSTSSTRNSPRRRPQQGSPRPRHRSAPTTTPASLRNRSKSKRRWTTTSPRRLRSRAWTRIIDPLAADGHATMLFDVEPSPGEAAAPETSFGASGRSETHSAAAATQLLDRDDAAIPPPVVPSATNFDEAFDFGFEDEAELARRGARFEHETVAIEARPRCRGARTRGGTLRGGDRGRRHAAAGAAGRIRPGERAAAHRSGRRGSLGRARRIDAPGTAPAPREDRVGGLRRSLGPHRARDASRASKRSPGK